MTATRSGSDRSAEPAQPPIAPGHTNRRVPGVLQGATRPALDMRAGWRGETPTRAFWTTCGGPESRVAPD
jgi:hypothetical protein